jgi:hypothetical protein
VAFEANDYFELLSVQQGSLCSTPTRGVVREAHDRVPKRQDSKQHFDGSNTLPLPFSSWKTMGDIFNIETPRLLGPYGVEWLGRAHRRRCMLLIFLYVLEIV